MQRVSGQKDPVIKLLRELVSEEGRRKSGLFFAEGDELVRRAFDYGGKVESLLVNEKYVGLPAVAQVMERAASERVDIFAASDGLLAKILDAKPTPECLAIVERIVHPLGEMFEGERPFIAMVEQCENIDNLGMLLRSTDAAGVSGVILTSGTVDPFHRRVVRGSRGAVFTVPICIHQDTAKVIEVAHDNGLQVIGASANTQTDYTSIDYTKPTMLIVGNEHTGISDTVRGMADAVVRIPMFGKINSLNIAVAASVMLYEVVRQRKA